MKRNFEDFIKTFLEVNKGVGAPTQFLKWSALSGIAGCLERRVWVVYNGTQIIYPNMYIMLIAESGIANKSTASRPIMELIQQVPGLSFASTQMSSAALVKQLQEAGENKTFHYNDEEFKNSSMFSYSSEARATLGDTRLGDIQTLLTDFYDCGDPAVWSNKKGWTKTLISTGKVTVYNPCLNILYCSTPSWLIKSIGKDGIHGGFASRCLFINQFERHQDNLGWLDEHEIDKDIVKAKKALVSDLTQMASLQGCFEVGKGFKDVYNKIRDDRNLKLDEAKTEMHPYYARKMWHCVKLAQVLTVSRTNELLLKPEILEEANAMLTELEPTMYTPFSNMEESPLYGATKSLWRAIKDKEKVAKRDVIRLLFKNATMRQIDEILGLLVNFKKIKFHVSDGELWYIILDHEDI